MYCYIIIIIILLLYYYISKKYKNKSKNTNTFKSIESIENKNIENKSIENKNKINLELPQPPSYEEVIKDTKKSKYKLCPFFNT
jgi:hypothetical protein